MPRKKMRKYRRRPRKGYNINSALSTAAKALTVAYGVKRLLNVEKKFADLFISAASPGTTATIGSMFTIAQGDTVNTRDGYSLKPIRLDIEYTFACNATTTPRGAYARLIIGQMRNDSDPTALTWLTGAMPNQLKNLDVAADARILVNRLVPIDVYRPKHGYITLTDKQLKRIQYDDSDTAGTSYRNGQLFYYFQSNMASGSEPQFNLAARLRYVDN